MDFKHIRYFVAVAEAGSFSAGARRAFVTQPTLSAAIASLEAGLGFALLERHARGVRLTPKGEEALETSRAILRQTERLKAASGKPSGRPLRLGILPTIAPAFVAQCIGRLRALEPGRSWRTEDAPLAKLRERLTSGRYDVILTALGSPARGHRQLELTADRQALAVSARAFPRGPVSPEILAGQPLIVRVHCEQLQSASRILDAWKVRPRVVAQTDSDARALAMVAAGLGFCLMPDSFEHPEVRMLRPEGVELTRRLGFEWVKGGGDGWLDRALDGL
ncbi:LysR family transcriptional regulator [Bradyrhizobium sp. WSM 1738]|uniref:LysR family transcriptional regulator n=1 Tax=Bradyrhizobium hereditatis TaxID=2821405 RepID=UPI001CE269F5|nr:LysR family transcriptional regulator [Bradyrhizobium hereditatis]MCA6114414.1 LysR family transcriptional regulator [Bradyrhizobium hereditatis]